VAAPAGRGQDVVCYQLGLNTEKVLTGPRLGVKACSQRLADGHECGQGQRCLVSGDSSEFGTRRSSCAMPAMQKCRQGWPLPQLRCCWSSRSPWGKTELSLPLAGDFPSPRCATLVWNWSSLRLHQAPAASVEPRVSVASRARGARPAQHRAPAATSCAAQPRPWAVQPC